MGGKVEDDSSECTVNNDSMKMEFHYLRQHESKKVDRVPIIADRITI